MNINMPSKNLCSIYKILGCIIIWIVYTYMIVQLLKLTSSTPEAKKLDFAQETQEVDQRASVCFKDVIPFSIPLIQGSQICQNKPELLIIIHTETDDFETRNAYRNEFVNRIRNVSAKYDFTVDVVYLIGLNKHYCILAKTVEEIVIHKDILVGSFIDNYYNQTLKSITMLEWFVKYCKSATVLLKIDDHMDPATSMETDDFYSLIRNVRNKDKLLIGSIHNIEVTTHQQIPWISLPYLYPGLPRNLHLNYLLSRDSAENLLKAYADTIYISIWKEDLYITGVLANVAKVKITHNKSFLKKCNNRVCLFCACGTPDSENSIEISSATTTTEKHAEFTSKKLVHSIPKRDTQTSFQMYSSQPFTTDTYPTTTQKDDIPQSTYFTTEYTTSENPTTNSDPWTATTHFTGKDGTHFNTEYTPTSGYTTTTQITENEDLVTTTEMSTTNTLGTTTTSDFQTTQNTEQTTQTTQNTEQTTQTSVNEDFSTTNLTPSTLHTTESPTKYTTNVANSPTTIGSDLSTTTEFEETISEIISITDIAILQIDEFTLGFEAILAQNDNEHETIIDTTSSTDVNTSPSILLPNVSVEETSNNTIFSGDSNDTQINYGMRSPQLIMKYVTEAKNITTTDHLGLKDYPTTWKHSIIEPIDRNFNFSETTTNNFLESRFENGTTEYEYQTFDEATGTTYTTRLLNN